MPSSCLLISLNNPNLKADVEALAKTPGICIFIDITGSTQMKCSSLKEWIAKIHNCFANAATIMPPQFTPIKSIGDALMYFIEDQDLRSSGYSPMQIYDGLWHLATETGSEFPDVKIGAAWCEEVYPITFFAGNRDYYGIDIDLTARLQSMANSKEVVIDSRLRDKVFENYSKAGNRDQFVGVRKLEGPEEVLPKGIPHTVQIYRSK
jgi:class 3 adenylate cyclase